MAFTDFTLETVEAELGVTPHPGSVFPTLPEVSAPAWLTDGLARGMELALVSENARSEFIVAPVLLGVRSNESCRWRLHSICGISRTGRS